MPDFLPPALQALRERTLEFADGTLVSLRDNAALSGAERHAAVCDASRAQGLYGLTQDPATPALALLVVREALASRAVSHLPGLFGVDAGVLAGVGEPLRSSHLVPLLEGRLRGGFAFTEPAGAARPTFATVDGDELVITGAKSYVTDGADADFLTALVDVEGAGPSMVVIDTTRPGVTLTRRFGSLDGSHHAAFAFDRVRVPRHHAIGAPGAGRSQALAKISAVRRRVAAECVGTIAHVLDVVAADLRRARRGGEKAASERIRLRLGELRIDAYAARAVVYRTARLVDAGDDAVNETIAAKVYASEAAGRIVDGAIQLVGGEALVDGHPLQTALRRLRSWRLAEGETDTLRVNLSRGFLDLGLGRI